MPISILPTKETFPQTFEDFQKIPLISTTIDRRDIIVYLKHVKEVPNNNKFIDGLQKLRNSLKCSLDVIGKIYQLQIQHETTSIEFGQMFTTDSIQTYLEECDNLWNNIGIQIRYLLDMIRITDYQDILPWQYQKFDLGDFFFQSLISDDELDMGQFLLNEQTKNISNYHLYYGDIEKVIDKENKDQRLIIN